MTGFSSWKLNQVKSGVSAVMNDQDEVLVIIHEYFLPQPHLGTWKIKTCQGATKTRDGVRHDVFGCGREGFMNSFKLKLSFITLVESVLLPGVLSTSKTTVG